MKKIFLLLSLLLFSASIAYATPSNLSIDTSISGNFDGETRVISGASFGTKSTAAPFKYDTFESGNVDDIYTATNTYGVAFSLTTNGNRHDNSSQCVVFNNAGATNITGIGLSGTYSDEFYVSAWIKRTTGTTFPDVGGKSEQHKLVRVGIDGGDGNYPNVTWGKHEGSTGSSHLYAIERVPESTISNFDANSNLWIDWEWHRVEGYFKASTGVGNADGEVKYWLDSLLVDSSTSHLTDDGSDNTFNGLWGVSASIIGQDQGNILHDEIYFDKTQSRVEIGDQPVFGNCAHREIQIPTAWTTTEITITLTQGTFSGSTNMYLFVIDGDGAVSDGLSVSGAGGEAPGDPDTTPPSIGGKVPSANSTGQSTTTSIVFVASDSASGVDADSLTASNAVSVSGVSYASGLAVTGTKESYTCTLDTDDYGAFSPGEVVDIGVNISDLSSNGVLETWQFTIEDNTVRWKGETLTLNGETFTLP